MIYELIGILSGFVFLAADIPYAIQTYRRKIKPHRITWFVIVVLNVIAFANQAASGATNSLWIFGAGVLATLLVFILSISRGVGGFSAIDIISLTGAMAGLALWKIIGTPLASIIATITVSLIALVPTYIKSYKNPKSESKYPWLIASISTILAAISVGKLDIQLLLLPIYSTVVQFGEYVLLAVREKQLKR